MGQDFGSQNNPMSDRGHHQVSTNSKKSVKDREFEERLKILFKKRELMENWREEQRRIKKIEVYILTSC